MSTFSRESGGGRAQSNTAAGLTWWIWCKIQDCHQRKEKKSSMDKWPLHCKATYRKQPANHTPQGSLESPIASGETLNRLEVIYWSQIGKVQFACSHFSPHMTKAIRASLLGWAILDHSHCYMCYKKLDGQPHNCYSRLYINSLMQAHKLSRRGWGQLFDWWAAVGSIVRHMSWSSSGWIHLIGGNNLSCDHVKKTSYCFNVDGKRKQRPTVFSRAGQYD